MDHLSKMSTLDPSNVAILNFSEGEINGNGGTLVIDEKLIPKIKFIKEGNFQQKGHPTLKLIGDVKPISLSAMNLTSDPNAPSVKVVEEDLQKLYPLDYKTLTKELKKRFRGFKLNEQFNKLLRDFKKDPNLCRVRYLDPRNQGGTKKWFYSDKIYNEFGKHYKSRSKRGAVQTH